MHCEQATEGLVLAPAPPLPLGDDLDLTCAAHVRQPQVLPKRRTHRADRPAMGYMGRHVTAYTRNCFRENYHRPAQLENKPRQSGIRILSNSRSERKIPA